MPTSVDIKNLKINKLTEAQYDTAVQGGVIGENELSVLTDVELEQIQVSALPTASADELGKIYQYVGATDSTYTNAYFYKCVSDGQSPATYSWEAVEVQASSGGLPDQTGQSGKFLTTDGTDASWTTISALQNTATGSNALTILGTATNNADAINIGVGSEAKSTGDISIGKNCSVSGGNEKGVGIGYNVINTAAKSVVIGADAQANNAGATAAIIIGKSAKITGAYIYGIAIGYGATVSASNAIQLGRIGTTGAATNSDANTFKVANANGNFELMSADGTIPKERLVNAVSTPSTMPELTVAGWSNNTQTVTVTGVTATNTVFVSPAPASASDYASAGIICTAQGTDSLTFVCQTTPTNNLTVNVVILG